MAQNKQVLKCNCLESVTSFNDLYGIDGISWICYLIENFIEDGVWNSVNSRESLTHTTRYWTIVEHRVLPVNAPIQLFLPKWT